MHKLLAPALVASLGAGALALAPSVLGADPAEAVSVDVPAEALGTYAIDGTHSTVAFRIRHLDVAYQIGRFNAFSGEVVLAEDPAGNSVSVTLDATSVDTNSDARDEHLRGPDFFDVKQFPEASFKSTGFVAKDSDTFTVTGELELHGKKRSVSFDIDFVGARDTGRMGFKAGFLGELVVQRRDFGIDTYPDDVLGNDVTLTFAIEANKK